MLDREKIEPLKFFTSLERVAESLHLSPHSRKQTGRMPVCRCPECGDEHHLALYENFHTFRPGIVHCFKCGFKGDVISLVRKTLCCNGGEAIVWLIKFNGLSVKDFQTPGPSTKNQDVRRI